MSKRARGSALAYIVIQTGLALVFFGIWGALGSFMQEDTIVETVLTVAPFFGFYVLGVLSRYVPGVRQVAKRMVSAVPRGA